MAGTFSQIYLHFVFAVHGRQHLIQKEYKEELHRYISSLVHTRKAKTLAVHCMPDHTHLFVGFKPSVLISDFVKEIKVESNEFIKSKAWTNHSFKWQEGYGVFSYGQSQIDRVCRYIQNQKQHHRKRTFREEYLEFMNRFNVPFEDQFLFNWVEEETRLFQSR